MIQAGAFHIYFQSSLCRLRPLAQAEATTKPSFKAYKETESLFHQNHHLIIHLPSHFQGNPFSQRSPFFH
jgi:hypothetical protein